jgi:chorismate--pyruvate lyase
MTAAACERVAAPRGEAGFGAAAGLASLPGVGPGAGWEAVQPSGPPADVAPAPSGVPIAAGALLRPAPSSRRLGAWMRVEGSLSARLHAVRPPLTVRVLRQGPVRLEPAEARRIGARAGQVAHGREVVLHADGVPVVYARSVLQTVHARGTWKAIRGLGTRALADMLFGLPAATRTPFEFVRFAPSSRWAAKVQRRWRDATGTGWGRREVWARCSVFDRRGAKLLVTECFAPAILALEAPQRARAVVWRR